MKKSIFAFNFLSVSFLSFFFICVSFYSVLAQSEAGTVGVASTHTVEGDFSYGDIVSFDKSAGIYRASTKRNDPDIFGVAVLRPALVFSTEAGDVPIIESGSVIVNITTKNGDIKPGDHITSSSIPGKGQKASSDDEYIIGIATKAFNADTEGAEPILGQDGVFSGSISVLMSAEKKRQKEIVGQDAGLLGSAIWGDVEKGGSGNVFGGSSDGGDGSGDGGGGSDRSTVNVVRVIIAAFVAIGSLFIALKNFMSVINKSIVSVGRNPLAKSSVWSMIIFNTVVAILISAAGIFLSIVIITAPI